MLAFERTLIGWFAAGDDEKAVSMPFSLNPKLMAYAGKGHPVSCVRALLHISERYFSCHENASLYSLIIGLNLASVSAMELMDYQPRSLLRLSTFRTSMLRNSVSCYLATGTRSFQPQALLTSVSI